MSKVPGGVFLLLQAFTTFTAAHNTWRLFANTERWEARRKLGEVVVCRKREGEGGGGITSASNFNESQPSEQSLRAVGRRSMHLCRPLPPPKK